jgi:hypothetical protein
MKLPHASDPAERFPGCAARPLGVKGRESPLDVRSVPLGAIA